MTAVRRAILVLIPLAALASSMTAVPPVEAALHPPYRLLDANGRSVVDTGGAVSPMRTCGACHDTAFIESHSRHTDVGYSASVTAGSAGSGRGWDFGPGLYGRWNPLTYRRLSPPGEAVTDLGLVDWIRFYGRRHVGGGPAAIAHEDASSLDPRTGERHAWDWDASGVVEMNCFLCHVERPDNAARIAELEAGRFRWAATATLAASGVVKRAEDRWLWNRDAFETDGTLKSGQLIPQDPRNDHCAQCHGLVAGEADLPVLLTGCDPAAWSTMTTGQIVSPQQIARSALNLRGKQDLTRAWDVHAERLMRCVDCHHSANNPAHEASRARPDHLRFDARRMSFGEYLTRPSHVLANAGSSPLSGSRPVTTPADGCRGCHRAEVSHDWLPFAERHMAVLSCNVCHTPRLHAPARRVVDWTVVTLDGKPRTECRGADAESFDAHDLIDGYEPVLLPRATAAGTRPVLVPHNLVTAWFWVAGRPERPVPPHLLLRAYLGAGRYRPEVLAALDDDRDGAVSSIEMILSTPTKVEAVRSQLESLGLESLRIVGEIQPYPIHHGVATGSWATKDCGHCHQGESRLARPFLLAARVPGGVEPTLVGDAEAALAGQLERDGGGRLLFAPTTAAAGLYVLGHDRARWANLLGIAILLATLLGVSVHAGLRWRAARSAPGAPDATDGPTVSMYSAYERLWHWLQALAILLLMLTGLEIHLPQHVSLLGFRLATQVHNVIGFVVLANALFAALYHLASGEIRQYVPAADGFFGQAIQQARYYLSGIFRGDPHPFEKSPHRKLNPLQQITYLAILNVLLPLQVVTGILIWGMQRWPAVEDWLGGLASVTALHTLGAWLFATFLAMHVYLTTTGPTPTTHLRAMILGWERRPTHTNKESETV